MTGHGEQNGLEAVLSVKTAAPTHAQRSSSGALLSLKDAAHAQWRGNVVNGALGYGVGL
jgi:hypothetical protein